LTEDPASQYFLPLGPSAAASAVVMRLAPGAWPSASAEVRAITDDVLGVRVGTVQSMGEALEPQFRPWRLGARLFTVFGALALLVTLVGVYSVTAYAAGQRTHEMGVRVALGAHARDIVRHVLVGGLRAVAVGAALGVGVALALGRLVEPLLYGVTPSDPATLAAAVAVLLLAGALASLVPAWRASRVDPVRALAAE
jgi:putative ABC transport system permease protein